VNEILATIRETWAGLSNPQRMAVGGGALVVALTLIILGLFYSREEYVPLFDYISDRQEALAVQTKLNELGIENTSTENGHIISVPRSKKENALLGLASTNSMPGGVLSYTDIMDGQSSFGLTDKELELRINRAKEGNLAKTIMTYRNIVAAKVHIEKAENTLFAEDQEDTRVSVMISMKNPLEKITSSQVRTILNLVTHSVNGVESKNVFISDSKGNDLIAMIQEKGKELSHYEMTVKKERELEKKAKQTLSEIYGENNVDVKVSVELDFNAMEEESKELAPPVDGEEQGVKISEEMKKTKSSTRDPKAIPGTTTNIPGYQQPEGTLSTSESEEARINYAYKSKQVKIRKAVGTVKRMTVSVVLNKEILPNKEMDQEIHTGIIAMISNAVGLDTVNRADTISVQAFSFNKEKLENKRRRSTELDEFNTKLASAGIVCGVAAAFLMIFRNVRRNKIAARERQLEIAQRSIAEQTETEEEVMTVEQRERHERERFLMEMARENPEELVKIIRSLMMDENYY